MLESLTGNPLALRDHRRFTTTVVSLWCSVRS